MADELKPKQWIRCMGMGRCNHAPGTCTASPEYQAMCAPARQPEAAGEPVAQEDELIERIARALDHPSVYMGGASQQSKLKARRAILPFIHEAHIEGGKMVQEACAEICEERALTRVELFIRALNVEDIVKGASDKGSRLISQPLSRLNNAPDFPSAAHCPGHSQALRGHG